VRHASWIDESNLDLLAELGVGICNIDQPLFHRSVKPATHVTSTIEYVRLHGRNYRNWFSATADVRERYDHLYSLDELEPWVTRTRQIAADAKDIMRLGAQSVNISASFFGNVTHPSGGSLWGLRLQIAFLFPK